MIPLRANHDKANLDPKMLRFMPLDVELRSARGGSGDENTHPEALVKAVACRTLEGLDPKTLTLPDITGFEDYYVTITDTFTPKDLREPPEVLKAGLTAFEDAKIISICKKRSEMSLPTMKQFAGPTNLGLMFLSAHYFVKYNVDIRIAGSFDAVEYALTGPSTPEFRKAWGIIATLPEGQSHVTPIICYQKDPSSPIHYIELDSIDTPMVYARSTLTAHKREDSDFKYYRVRGSRQLDAMGCRTDALCLLKDVLRLLEHETIDDMDTYLGASPVYGNGSIFDLPSSWAKTVQSPAVLKKVSPEAAILSSSCSTLQQFRSKYTIHGAVRHESYRVDLELKTGERLVRDFSISIPKAQVAYLNYKGKRNFEKLKAIILENNSTIRRRFLNLEAFFPGKKI